VYIEDSPKLDFDDVLIRPKYSSLVSRKDVDLIRTFTFLNSKLKYKGIPIIASNMDTVGTIPMAKELVKYKMMTALHKHLDLNEIQSFMKKEDNTTSVFCTVGATKNTLEQVTSYVYAGAEYLCVDVANGYTHDFVNTIKRIRKKFPNLVIMAGNVVTNEMVENLLFAGADIIKVGLGSGSVCSTRKVAGVGYPQLSSIIECADAAHGLGGLVCSDGGCKTPGDIAKAFGAGADFVMLGGMLAGHNESGGDDILDNVGNVIGKKFYGMSSSEAMLKHYGEISEHRAPEGKTVTIPYRGPIKNTVQEILGGLRSACSYTGSKKLKELSKRTTFVKVYRTHNTIYGN
jgi:GMP reductase